MRNIHRFSPWVTGLAVLLLLPFVTFGQMRSGVTSRATVRASSARSSMRASLSAATPRRNNQSFGAFLPSGSYLNPGFGLGTGLGSNLGIEAAIDPATQWRLYEARRFLRSNPGLFGGGGYYLLDGGVSYPISDDSDSGQEPAQQQEPMVIVQKAPEANQSEEPSQAQQAPDVGQFVLILRNGQQIDAVAFTRLGDRIVYITADGARRTIAAADLNSDATVRINQERGTPLQLPL